MRIRFPRGDRSSSHIFLGGISPYCMRLQNTAGHAHHPLIHQRPRNQKRLWPGWIDTVEAGLFVPQWVWMGQEKGCTPLGRIQRTHPNPKVLIPTPIAKHPTRDPIRFHTCALVLRDLPQRTAMRLPGCPGQEAKAQNLSGLGCSWYANAYTTRNGKFPATATTLPGIGDCSRQ
jgi:hypothetical protein